MADLTLVLNAAEKRLQYILLEDDIFLLAEESEPQKNGADCLLSDIRQSCQKLGFHPHEITRIAGVAGPGNFMGIRLTATIAAAFARANNGLQASISYMQALAHNYFPKDKCIIHVVTSATRELVHSQLFRYENGKPCAVSELRLLPYTELADIGCDFCLGSGLRSAKAPREEIARKAIILPNSFDSPAINSLISCLEDIAWTKEDISPIYLKECDALQNLPQIARQQGRNPDESRQELERLLKA